MIVQCDKEQKKLCLVIRDCPHRAPHERQAYTKGAREEGFSKHCTQWGYCWLVKGKIRCTKVRVENFEKYLKESMK